MDLIQGVVVRPLKQIHDERGYLMEMLRTDWPEFERFAQSYVTIGYPGIVKGWHYHKKQTDHFVVVRGTAKVVCYDNRDRSPTKGKVNEFFPGERNPMVIKIPPYVVHGFKAVGPEPVYLVNFPTDVMGTSPVLEAGRKNDLKRIPHTSTDEVYGEAPGRPSTELDPLMPKSPYAASKAGADRLAYSYFTTYGLPVVISRCTNNYGPYQHPEKLIPLFVTNALEDKPLPVYGTGKNTRDWIHVDDHCAALEGLLEAKGVAGEVFNIGASEEHSVNEIASAILKTLGKPKSLLKAVPDRPGHVQRHAGDAAKIRSKLHWKPS